MAFESVYQGSSATTSPYLSSYPTYPTDSYNAPEYDWERINALTQQQMAGGLSKLKRGLQSVTSQYYTNPAERALAYRQAMSGYGEGLGGLQSGAATAAVNLYSPEYTAATEEAKSAYSAGLAKYNADVAAWQAQQAEEQEQDDYYESLAAKGLAYKDASGNWVVSPAAYTFSAGLSGSSQQTTVGSGSSSWPTPTTGWPAQWSEYPNWWEQPATTQPTNYYSDLASIDASLDGGISSEGRASGFTYYDPVTGLTYDENGMIIT